MNISIKFSSAILVFTFLIAMLLVGCNNPVQSEEEHHQEADGAVFKMNGEEIVRYENGESSGSIDVNKGEETPLITIYFLDEEGNEFQPDDPENSLSWKDIDTAIADVEQHDQEGKWSFHISGLSQGSTTVTFQLFHNGHSDFDMQNITINVN